MKVTLIPAPTMRSGCCRVLTVLSFTILTLAGPGCSVHYDILLNNGATVTAFSKPKPDGQGLLRFKNEAGEEVAVKEIRVIEIRAK